ncbi:MAG: hypothetical protein AVDCRST_MAG93-9914 [uncultured Chloroflexia bacterium]|uniref:Uncharacterized protein n=1 Tax=uncultured Chloroflexia bacterium TaxID=1672391 RepID=A0A6J4NQT8_9CHLR|nr:MAG: hypothetical protein AVDCRST_MAG93-9914 [uncultured Chloroflexia bacterium]
MGEDRANRRWDTDTIGHGVADGTAFAPRVQQLLDTLHLPNWVAEDPDVHVLPHLRAFCEAPDSPWRLVATVFSNAVYEVTLDWGRQDATLARLRADIFCLVGAIAEGVTYVQQQVAHDQIMYETITGLLAGDTPFRGHGHLVRFRVGGKATRSLLQRMQPPVIDDALTEP